ncbi:MAG TPA: GMC family oxidoreductase [Acidobacteriaceae bacterium]|jgi:choline dehydrogenase-like flavoprotein|nr:GMC family oxidoreductase [Acidobacteriaceae bacterium]
MEIDLAHLDSTQSTPLRAHVCIIGTGIAGLTLAHKLTQFGADVLLLEAGGRTKSTSPANEVIQRGYPHPGTSESRVQALGGTSLTWGGQLLPLPQDSNWPIPTAELAPFTAEAEHLLGVDDLPYDAPAFFTHLQQRLPALLQQLPLLELTLSKFAPFAHRNLAHTLGHELRAHANTRILLHARATELLLSLSRDAIEAVLVRSPAGHTHRIEATHIVLAAGTIETARLLLASRSIAPEGVGNRRDQVGRNFHDHLTFTAATLHPPARARILSALRPWVYGHTLHSLKLIASRELRDQLDLTPVLAHLTIDEPESSGIAALRNILRARQQGSLAASLRASLPHLPQALRDAALLAWSARIRRRRYISPQATVLLRLNAAQQTPSASRITLSSELDSLAQPKAVLDWRIDPRELATLRAFAAHLRAQLEPANLTGLDWNPSLFTPDPSAPIANLDDARHAMGGTSMGADPHTSVVTPELRVHGLRNLFIASAAVFPDGSPQLPTLPLMALTLRLAQHLHQQHRTED